MKKTAMFLAVLGFFGLMSAQIASTQDNANVNGTWDVTIRMPDKNVIEKWSFKEDGAKVTGTAKSDRGELPVSGTFESAFLRVDEKDGDMLYKIRATFDTDTLDGSITMGKNEYLWSAKRVKS
jgi:hypothetical protein